LWNTETADCEVAAQERTKDQKGRERGGHKGEKRVVCKRGFKPPHFPFSHRPQHTFVDVYVFMYMCFVSHTKSEIPVFDTPPHARKGRPELSPVSPPFLFLLRSEGKINCRAYEEETVADGFGVAVRTMRFKSFCGVYTKVPFFSYFYFYFWFWFGGLTW
jgi:hypothetical protein